MMLLKIVLIVVAVLALLVLAFVVFLPWIFAPLLRLLFLPRYGFRIQGREHIPRRGAVVLAANHVSWIDALFLAVACPRRGYILANAGFFKSRILARLAFRVGVIPVPFVGPKAQRAAIVAARDALDRGQVFGIFPEGQLTRNGMLGAFYRGLDVILKGRPELPVVPVYFDNLWGSIWSFQGGQAFRKRPVGLRRVVNIVFGPPLTGPPTLHEIRIALQSAGVDAVRLRVRPMAPLETIEPELARFDHPELGSLTASAANFDRAGAIQVGNREGTVGGSLPGVALRAVNEAGNVVGENQVGRIEARTAGHPSWTPTGKIGRIDIDGFLTLITDAD